MTLSIFSRCINQNLLKTKISSITALEMVKHNICSMSPTALNLLQRKDSGKLYEPKTFANCIHTSSQIRRSGPDIISNLKQLPSSPVMALILGAGSLAPFVVSPYLMLSSGVFAPDLAVYQTMYGASVLSFLGGARWGLTLPPGSSQSPDSTNLGYSGVPLLWAWGALAAGHYLDCLVVGNVGVALGLGITGYIDMTMYGYPAWYKGLRFCLTLGAVLSMVTALLCKFALDEQVQKTDGDAGTIAQ